MESVARILLMVLLTVSAVSAVQFSIQKSVEGIRAMSKGSGCEMEQVAESAVHAIERSVAHMDTAVWIPGVVAEK